MRTAGKDLVRQNRILTSGSSFAWMVSTSLKNEVQAFVFPPEWIPNPLKLENYPEAFAIQPNVLATNAHCVFAARKHTGIVALENESGGKISYATTLTLKR